jgi:hypothetical protein
MLPTLAGGLHLTGITPAGAPVPYSTKTIKGASSTRSCLPTSDKHGATFIPKDRRKGHAFGDPPGAAFPPKRDESYRAIPGTAGKLPEQLLPTAQVTDV